MEEYDAHRATFRALFNAIAEFKAAIRAQLETQEAKNDPDMTRMLKGLLDDFATLEADKMLYRRQSLRFLQSELAHITVAQQKLEKDFQIYNRNIRDRTLSEEVSSTESELSSAEPSFTRNRTPSEEVSSTESELSSAESSPTRELPKT